MNNENTFSLDMQSEISNFATNLQNPVEILSTNLSNIERASFDSSLQNNNFENTIFADPITENLSQLNVSTENIPLNPTTDVFSETTLESSPISDAAFKNELINNDSSSQENIYLEMNRMNLWMQQVNESLNNKADLLSNESIATSQRYQISAENIMFFDRLSNVNQKPSWG